MRARSVTVIALGAGLALAGCGGGSPSSSASGSTSASSPANPDEAFKLDVQRDGLIPAGNDTAATASVRVAHATCELRDAGSTRNASIRQLAANSNTWDVSQASEFLGYAEKYYCPKYVGRP